ncbi:hypothetical protein D3C86_2016260 [compost metagenome]
MVSENTDVVRGRVAIGFDHFLFEHMPGVEHLRIAVEACVEGGLKDKVAHHALVPVEVVLIPPEVRQAGENFISLLVNKGGVHAVMLVEVFSE